MAEPLYPDALPALTHLHWYVLERVLGQGGFGITYLAKDTNLDQRVAIKEYLPAEFASRLPDATVRPRTEELRDRYRWGLERFIQEARTLARFDHPNIVRVHSVFELHGTAYMVMRFEEGGTLAALLDRRGTLPEAELLRILLPVLDGLELVHQAGFIHRDIKPDNIHLRGDGRPVLLDFGSARQAVGSNNTLTILIAPGYAPFEQYYSDPSSQGPWTDIYGLAATAYRAICGRAPLDAVSRSKGILGSTQEIMVPASVVGAGRYSGRVLGAIDHGLAFGEKDRPQSIAEWRRELTGEAAAPAIVADARTPPPRPVTAEPTVQTAPRAATRRLPNPAEPPPSASTPPMALEPAPRARLTPSWAWALVAVAVGVGIFVVYGSLRDRSDFAALQKQWQEKVAADERERLAKLQADEAEKKRREQVAPEERKAQSETVAAAPAPPPKPREESAPRTVNVAANATKDAKSSVPSATKDAKSSAPSAKPQAEAKPAAAFESSAAAPKEAAVTLPTPVASVKETPAPEPKPAPRSPAEQIAEADTALGDQRYADATKILRPLAEVGNAPAQARLAGLYADGRGVDRDPAAARGWYEKAANGGDTGAMLKLGAMFAAGGAQHNDNLAYIWYGTAAELGSSAARAERDRIARQLQPAERQQAERVIRSKVEQVKKGKES